MEVKTVELETQLRTCLNSTNCCCCGHTLMHLGEQKHFWNRRQR